MMPGKPIKPSAEKAVRDIRRATRRSIPNGPRVSRRRGRAVGNRTPNEHRTEISVGGSRVSGMLFVGDSA